MNKLLDAQAPFERKVVTLLQKAGLSSPDKLVGSEYSFFALYAPDEQNPEDRDPAFYAGAVEGYTVSADEDGNDRIVIDCSNSSDVNGNTVYDLSWVEETGWVLRSEDFDDLQGILKIQPKATKISEPVAVPAPAKPVAIKIPADELAIGTVLRVEMIPEGAIAQLVNNGYGETKFFRRASGKILETEFGGDEWKDKTYGSQTPHPKQLCWLVELL